MTLSKLLRSSILGATLACAALGSAHPALAHAHLKSETPAADAAVASPSELKLKFSEALELKFTTVKVTGPAKVATGSATLDPADATLLIVPLSGSLPPGRYKVEWHATATDTHKTDGSYSFTVKP